MQTSARSQYRPPGGARRDRQDRRLLAAARASGSRVDAVPFLIETTGTRQDPDSTRTSSCVTCGPSLDAAGDAILLGEVNLEPEQQRRFFGDEDGDELHMCLNFNINQAMALALVREEAAPLVEALRALTPIPEDAQWGNFVRNHDEWSLDKLSEAERQEVFATFGPEADMQLFGRGLRRRLPSMLGGDQARMRMVYSPHVLAAGAPVLFYGEEIGMAENLEIDGRMSVRSPMQWSGEANAGLLHGSAGEASTARGVRRRLRAFCRQRRRPAPRQRIAAQLDGPVDLHAEGMPGDRLGDVSAA